MRGWRRFQHYDPTKRNLPWIKNYLELMRDDAYMDLTGNQRAILHGLWLEYASTRCQLHADTRSLSRRLNLRVTKQQLETLNHAGFIDIVASKVLADGYQPASTEIEREIEKEKKALSLTLSHEEALAQLDAMGAHVSLEDQLRATLALSEQRKANP